MTREGIDVTTEESEDHASMIASSMEAIRVAAYARGQDDGYRAGKRAGIFRAALACAGIATGSYLANGHLPFVHSDSAPCTTYFKFVRDDNGLITGAIASTKCE